MSTSIDTRIATLFDIMDSDDDLVDRDGFARSLRLRGITDPDDLDVFDGLDTDADDAISREEYVRSWRDFFHSDDPGAPGILYFGRF